MMSFYLSSKFQLLGKMALFLLLAIMVFAKSIYCWENCSSHEKTFGFYVVHNFKCTFEFVIYWLWIVFQPCWSGYATDNIIRVLQGERIGTVFHKDAHLWTNIKEVSAHEMAVAARDGSRRLQVNTVIYWLNSKTGISYLHILITKNFLQIGDTKRQP